MPRETREQRSRQQALELVRALGRRQEFSHDSLQTIRGRSSASELTIHATTAAAEVNASLLLLLPANPTRSLTHLSVAFLVSG